MEYITLSTPNFIGNEQKYTSDAISTTWVSTGGQYINTLENDIAQYVGCESSVAVCNGTSALHLALKLLGVTDNCNVIVPTVTFMATVNPISYLGATPIFMDCDDTLNMDIDKLSKFLEQETYKKDNNTYFKHNDKVIKALVIVHIFGNLANMDKLMELSDEYNIKILEDSAESIGGYYTDTKYKGQYSGTIGHAGVYSFNGNKIITTGGGGLIVSHDNELLKKAKHLSTQAKTDEIYFKHDEVGYNYRMTNLQACIGVAQFECLEKFIQIKNDNYEYYKQKIKDIKGLSLLPFNDFCRSNKWFYSLVITEEYKLNVHELIKKLQEHNIQSRPIWSLVHEQIPFINSYSYEIEKANYYVEHILNIPCSTHLTHDQIDYITDILKKLND